MRQRKGNSAGKGKSRQWHQVSTPRPDTPHLVPIPPRVRAGPVPRSTIEPTVGRWLWTCREGFEAHLFEELAWSKGKPKLLGPTLVESDAVRGDSPVFARMGFRVERLAKTPEEVGFPAGAVFVQAWVPDSTLANGWSSEAASWEAALREKHPDAPDNPWKAWEANSLLGQVCLVAPRLAAVGHVPARQAVSIAAGGRTRMKRTSEAPSRAAMKLDEAIEWYGVSPGKGDLCVDLGSAPGGWTRRLLERGARVWSVDPANLAPDVAKQPKLKHFKESAFQFEPHEPADWLFCDMAWRPLEVAQMIAKWARRGWASQVISNIKLPMKDKLPMLVRVRATLEEAGWAHVRIRQLYHDRDEVTLSARMR